MKFTVFQKPSEEELHARLTPEQYHCTQENGTERAFHNAYWDNKANGIYVDVVSGEPLFTSLTKFDSGSGWPSFTSPISADAVKTLPDTSHGMLRTEVRSSLANSHLGHVFNDGPAANGLRYCINSAALRFVPLEQLKQEGYGEFLFQFVSQTPYTLATLAGGCFWGVEDLLRKEPGVIETRVGYTGGSLKSPTYPDVKSGETGHAECVQILFNEKETSFENILLFFFAMHNPTTPNQQGNDLGSQYRSAIFCHSPEQKEIAARVIARVNASGQWKKPVVTEVQNAADFWVAETYHQKYLNKNPKGYTCHFVRNMKF